MRRTWSRTPSRTSSTRSARPGIRGSSTSSSIGGDATIPFFRYPDEALLAPESQFNAGVLNTSASQASLSLNYVLSQDAYGADISVAQNANAFPVPDLAVGRLVETASEASTVLGAYLSDADGVVSASSSLVTGYDFLSDAADAVSDDLAAGTATRRTS